MKSIKTDSGKLRIMQDEKGKWKVIIESQVYDRKNKPFSYGVVVPFDGLVVLAKYIMRKEKSQEKQ